MKNRIKITGLIIGLISVFLSFLFFGRQHATYQIILFSGLTVALIFYLTIVFGKSKNRTKALCTMAVVLAYGIQYVTEPLLIQCSFLIFLNNNSGELVLVNSILQNKKNDVFISKGSIIDNNNQLSDSEKQSLAHCRDETGAYMISKVDDQIHYELWGFLDERIGLTYNLNNTNIGHKLVHIKDRWYYRLD